MNVSGVSFSSDKKLSRCEQQYSYRYDEKLKKRVKTKGLYMGDILHRVIKTYRLKGDWEKTLRIWKKREWGKLFDEEREMYEENGLTPEIVYNLMSHYVEHWGEEDAEWKPLFVEQSFTLETKWGIPIRFICDYIAQKGKQIALFENKNKGKLPDVNERMLAPQPHSYAFLLSKLPQPIHVTTIIWDYIRTEPVPSPQLLKNGDISHRKINTDQRTYLKFLKDNDIKPEGEEAEAMNKYINGLPETLTLTRVTNHANLKVGERFVRDWLRRANRAKNIEFPTRNWNKQCHWDCDYLDLCRADMLGKPDRNTIIRRDFVTNIKKADDNGQN
jgi:PD-(D/E)XK nuclease superfamily